MALITEDGTGLANAESYISVAEADTYFSNRGITLWATMLEAEKEQALRRAVDYLGGVYRLRWKGTRVNGTQALDWPRAFVEREDYEYAGMNGYTTIGGRFYYPSDEVPVEVKNACAEMAFKAASGELAPDLERSVVREKVDVLEVEYDRYAPQYKQYRAIDNLLAPFLEAVGGAFRKVVRT
jgi:hypothetical protein